MFEWILHIIEVGGYAGIFFLMVLENIFPPIPSELIIPLAGFAAAKGNLNIFGVLFATISGGLVGGLPWYLLGRMYGIHRLKALTFRFGRIMGLSADDVDGAHNWFKKHGNLAVLFGRLAPTVRTLISVPAGMAKMPIVPYLVYSLIGTSMWTIMLLFFGYILESQYQTMAVYIDYVSNAIIIAFISIYLYRVITYKNVDTKEV